MRTSTLLATAAAAFLAIVTATAAGAATVNALQHFGFHVNNDGLALDLDNNGGMLNGGDPAGFTGFFGSTRLTTGPAGRGLDFDNDADFIASGAVGRSDDYSNLWLGTLTVTAAEAGTWSFRNAGDDDRAGIWLDVDQDGVFESSTPGLGSDRGEQLSWETIDVKSVLLAAGDYRIAFTHREGSGGSRADFRFRSPTTGFAEAVIKPADPLQAGLWTSPDLRPLPLPGAAWLLAGALSVLALRRRR
ncbi:MAG: hypothetical protein ACU85V_00280 [Gammaproteobacteria bacterium]